MFPLHYSSLALSYAKRSGVGCGASGMYHPPTNMPGVFGCPWQRWVVCLVNETHLLEPRLSSNPTRSDPPPNIVSTDCILRYCTLLDEFTKVKLT